MVLFVVIAIVEVPEGEYTVPLPSLAVVHPAKEYPVFTRLPSFPRIEADSEDA